MATEDSVKTTTTRTAGGSPYLQSFIAPAETARTAQFERELQMTREGREQEKYELAKGSAMREEEAAQIREARMQHKEDRQTQRQQFMDDWRMRQEERAADLDMLKFRQMEAKENLGLREMEEQTRAEEAATKFAMLDPNKLSFGYDARNTITDRSVSSALAGKYGSKVKAILDEKMASHDNIIKHFQAQAEEAGLAGDVRQFADKTGMMDEVKFSNALESAKTVKASKMAEQQKLEEDAAAMKAASLGLVPESFDPKTKGIKYGLPKPIDPLAATAEAGSKPKPSTSPLPKKGAVVTLDDFPTKPENSPPVIP